MAKPPALLSFILLVGCSSSTFQKTGELDKHKWRAMPETQKQGNRSARKIVRRPAFLTTHLDRIQPGDLERAKDTIQKRYPRSVEALSAVGVTLHIPDLKQVARSAGPDGELSLINWVHDHKSRAYDPYDGADPKDAVRNGEGLVLAMALIERNDLLFRDTGFSLLETVAQRFFDVRDQQLHLALRYNLADEWLEPLLPWAPSHQRWRGTRRGLRNYCITAYLNHLPDAAFQQRMDRLIKDAQQHESPSSVDDISEWVIRIGVIKKWPIEVLERFAARVNPQGHLAGCIRHVERLRIRHDKGEW